MNKFSSYGNTLFFKSIGYILFSTLLILIIASILIITFNSKISEVKIKLIIGYFKYIIGSVVLVLITFLIGKGLEERRLAITESQHLNEQVKYLVGQKVGVKKEYVQYFSIVTKSMSTRNRWIEYYNTVKDEYDIELKKKETAEKEIKYNESILKNEYNKNFLYLNRKIDSLENQGVGNKTKRKKIQPLIDQAESDLLNVKKSSDSLQLVNYELKQEKQKINLKLESAADKKLNLMSLAKFDSKTFVDFIQPIVLDLRASKDIYENNYIKNGYKYKDAKLLYDLNLKIKDLILNQNEYLPFNLVGYSKDLVDHINAWIIGFENTLDRVKSPSPDTKFRIYYTGPTFPFEASKAFEAELRKNSQ